MPSAARDRVVENAVSRQAEELAAKSADAHGAQTKSQQQAQPSKQDSANDASREGTGKPARRKRSTKATKTQQAPPTPAPTVKLKVEVGSPPEKSVAPQANNAVGKANGWENAATKVRALIRFVNHADAIIGIKGVR